MEIPEQGDNSDGMQLMEGEENVNGQCNKVDGEVPARCLKLKISDSFLSSIRLMLVWHRSDSVQSKYNDRSKYEKIKAVQNQLTSEKKSKITPTELPLLTLFIGSKKFIHMDECDLFAKFCYRGKKIVCQMCNDKLSRKVAIPFSDITSLLVCFDHRGFDNLRIEAKSPFKSFSAEKPYPGKFPDWKVVDAKEDDCFPESKFVFLEIEKGMLEKGLAKLLYTDPRLQRVVNFARGSYGDQDMYHGRVHAQMQQTNMPTLHPSSEGE